MGKSTISMAIFNSYVKLPEGNFNSRITNSKNCINFWKKKIHKKNSPMIQSQPVMDPHLIKIASNWNMFSAKKNSPMIHPSWVSAIKNWAFKQMIFGELSPWPWQPWDGEIMAWHWDWESHWLFFPWENMGNHGKIWEIMEMYLLTVTLVFLIYFRHVEISIWIR